MIQIGVGVAPNTTYVNVLVDLQATGLLLFSAQNNDTQGNPVNNSFYDCSLTCTPSNNSVSWNNLFMSASGLNYSTTIYMGPNNTAEVTNLNFVYQNSSLNPAQTSYVNLTNISGILGASQAYLTQYAAVPLFGLQMDANQAIWGWNPMFNATIPESAYFYFGSQLTQPEPGTPMVNFGLDDIYSGASSLGGINSPAIIQTIQIVPDFQYVGVPSTQYTTIKEILAQQGGIVVENYQLDFQSKVMYVNGTLCQDLNQTAAYNWTYQLTFNSSHQNLVVNLSVPLTTLMTNVNGSCFIQFQSSQNGQSDTTWLGQAFLQSFQINVNYINPSTIQISPTTLGLSMGSSVSFTGPTPPPPTPIASPTQAVNQPYLPINGPQLMVQVIVGTVGAPYSQTLNLLVSLEENVDGMLLFGQQVSNTISNPSNSNNQVYACGPSCNCNFDQFVNWSGSFMGFNGIACTDTLTMSNGYTIPNFPFGFASPYSPESFVVQSGYQNLTNIAGIISANSSFLQSYYGNSTLSISQDASPSTWSWNPNYNPLLTPNQYFYFGNQTQGLTNSYIPLSSLNSTNATFGGVSQTSQNVIIVPEFEFLGLTELFYQDVLNQINLGGIPATINTLSLGSATPWQSMWVQNSTCQSFMSTTAYTTNFVISKFNSQMSLTFVGVPLSSLMTTQGNDCYIGIYNSIGLNSQALPAASANLYLGQAFLQSFTVNIDYNINMIQFAPTAQGSQLGAFTAELVIPTPSVASSVNQTYVQLNDQQLVIQVGFGPAPFTTYYNLLVDLQLDVAGALLFGKNFNSAVYSQGISSSCGTDSSNIWSTSFFNVSTGHFCNDTIYMQNGQYVINNFYYAVADDLTLYQYVNLTGIAGIMGANTYLQQYFGSPSYSFSQSPNNVTWGWNSLYNSNLATTPYFQFGTSTSQQLLNEMPQASNAIYGTVTFSSNQVPQQFIEQNPSFQYLGISNTFFNLVQSSIKNLGIQNVTSYQLPGGNSTWNIMWVQNSTCQSLSNTAAFNTPFQIQQFSTSTQITTTWSVPLSALMTTVGNYCLIGIYDLGTTNTVVVGQSYLQSYVVTTNVNSGSSTIVTTPQALTIGSSVSQSEYDPEEPDNDAAEIVGIIIGVILGLLLIGLIIQYYIKKNKNSYVPVPTQDSANLLV